MKNNATERQTVTKRFRLSNVFGRPLALALGLLAMLSLLPSSFGQSPTYWSSDTYTYTSPYGARTNPYTQGLPAPPTTTLKYGNPYGSAQEAVHVRGYSRQDGGSVAPHYRSAPDGTRLNNWSTWGNVNPYTGKVGSRRQ